MDKVICIVGPTGVGKTKLSIALAKELNTEIINGDAIQVFEKVDILSARIKKEEQENIKHHLLDFLKIEDTYDVACFKQDAASLIKKMNINYKIPIIVGGSGLYLKSLLYDYTFDKVKQRDDSIMNEYNDYTNDQLYEYLQEIDEESAKILHPNNRKRVARAIEIYKVNKISKTQIHAAQKKELEYDALIIGLNTDREVLYKQINKRVDLMVEQGLVNEVKDIYNEYQRTDYQVMQAIGYKELIPFLNNEEDFNVSLDKIKQNSRRYAKKQLTWFNNQMNVQWLESNLEDFEQTIEAAKKIVKEFINNDKSI